MTPPEEEFSLEALFDAGLTAEMRGDMDTAIDSFLEVIKYNPRHGAAYLQLGKCYMRRGDARRAGHALQRGIKVDPKSAPLRAELGILLIVLGDLKRAEIALSGARKLSKKNTRALHGLIWLYVVRREWGQAVSLVQDLSNAAAKSFVGQFLIARVQDGVGNLAAASMAWAAAKKLCEDALDVSEDQPAVHFFLGEVMRYNADWNAALESYETAAAAAPDEPGCAFALGLGVTWATVLETAAQACRETGDDERATEWSARAEAVANKAAAE